jgi:hypothetical protein
MIAALNPSRDVTRQMDFNIPNAGPVVQAERLPYPQQGFPTQGFPSRAMT